MRPFVLSALLCMVSLAAAATGAGAAQRAARVEGLAASGPRVTMALPPGLGQAEQSALERAGAFGAKPIHFLMVGDSIALTLGEGLSVGSHSHYGVTIDDNATLGCDLESQLEIRNDGVPVSDVQGCGEWKGLWPFLVARLHPQVVALGLGRWEVTDHLVQGRWVHIGQRVWDTRLTADMERAIAILHSVGARVVLLTMPYIDPSQHRSDGLPYAEDTPARAQAYNALVRQVARHEPNVVSVIDLNRMLAPHGAYAASLDGVDVRSSDGIHISPDGGELLQSEILPKIAQLGLKAEAQMAGTRSTTARTRPRG